MLKRSSITVWNELKSSVAFFNHQLRITQTPKFEDDGKDTLEEKYQMRCGGRLLAPTINHQQSLLDKARLVLRSSNSCWRCEISYDALMHMVFSCPMFEFLWFKIILLINKVINSTLVSGPVLPHGHGFYSYQISW